MKTKLTLLFIMFITMISFAQNGINYKALIKDDLGNVVANDLIQIQFKILEGAAQTIVYSESHSPTTDANGTVIVNIGEGALVSGSAAFNTIDWSSNTHFLQVWINIGSGLINMGTTEFKTVPYALSAGNKTWSKNSNAVFLQTENVGIGTNAPTDRLEIQDNFNAGIKLVVPTVNNSTKVELRNGEETGSHSFYKIENKSDNLKFYLDSDLTTEVGYDPIMSLNSAGLALKTGQRVNAFSADGTLSGNSNYVIPTEKAVKTYVDSKAAVLFKVRGNGFAVKDINAGTEVETDIWDTVDYDTNSAFNTVTRRFVAPTAGYYFLHACVSQSNTISTASFRIHFNIDVNVRYSTSTTGHQNKTEVSGIYYLTAGKVVYVLLRNYSTTENEKMNGYGSWFEGYKIN
ncbi:hypothetical protein [Bizionia myxarmorum]|uniref:C1q domain-containing protein n=1 Tax=Bizionia myxarmorum TaxID=291186 RepID=A0A5D0R6F7_9FLAO|nr:hypothetical protein [Bizionia myxarmorum]TYB76451.1 hypothetical protein ES674_12790 [Bizionia myxarmorum]